MNPTKRRLPVALGRTPVWDPATCTQAKRRDVCGRQQRRTISFRAAWIIAAGLVLGCGGSAQKSSAKTAEGETLPIAFQHEPCDLSSSGVEKIDVRANGKPGMVRVLSGSREVCRMLDFNHDGVPDSFVYMDDQGRTRRRESDFDRDGKVDEVDTYVGGTIVRKDRATTLDGRFHTWDFYEGGKLHHRLRDSDSDGKVDQWWAWPVPDKLECAVIRTDINADGRPDDSTAIDQCAPNNPSGTIASAAPSPTPAPGSSASTPTAAPSPSAGVSSSGIDGAAASGKGRVGGKESTGTISADSPTAPKSETTNPAAGAKGGKP